MNRKKTGSLRGIRTAALAAAAVLAAGALWGCGARAGGTGARADVVKDGRVQVTLWYSGGKTAAGVMEELIGDFNSSQQQYQVTGRGPSGLGQGAQSGGKGAAGRFEPLF